MDKGRKPKPTALRLLEGNREHRKIKNNPQPQLDFLETPKWLKSIAREEWERMVPLLYNLGLLTAIDKVAFEGYCQCYARWRQAEEKVQIETFTTNTGFTGINQYINIANRYSKEMRAYLTEFGMTPSSRAKLDVKPNTGKPSKMEGLVQ